jgi:hypothetical protein
MQIPSRLLATGEKFVPIAAKRWQTLMHETSLAPRGWVWFSVRDADAPMNVSDILKNPALKKAAVTFATGYAKRIDRTAQTAPGEMRVLGVG